MTRRRDLLLALGAAAFSPGAVLAQSKQPVLIGWLNGGSRETNGHLFAAFMEGLSALGWKEGSQVAIEQRWADGRTERLPALAQELAVRRPAVIVAFPIPATAAAAKAAPRIPIVMLTGGDPVAAGLVKSLARPGGMITGIAGFAADISEKFLELLLGAAPKVRRVGFLWDPTALNPGLVKQAAYRSAAKQSIDTHFAEVARPEEIEPAISRLAKEGAQALVVFASQTFFVERRRIVKLALARRWPLISGQREWADEGALLSYGTDASANHRRTAYYVDRILKGAKPGELPIEQPTKFEFVINRKTARALGIMIPQAMLERADKVIE